MSGPYPDMSMILSYSAPMEVVEVWDVMANGRRGPMPDVPEEKDLYGFPKPADRRDVQPAGRTKSNGYHKARRYCTEFFFNP